MDSINNYPKISIITPSYNQGQYLEQTILSVINQQYPNLEYIIIDGGSTDNSVEIIKKYEKYLTYWVSEKDNGQSHAINKGLEKCTGDIFNWINSDDYLAENSLWTVGRLFAEKKPDMIIGNLRTFNDQAKNEYIYRGKPQIYPELEFMNNVISQPTMFYAMRIIHSLGKEVCQNLRYVMDLNLWCQFRFRFPNAYIVYSDELLAHFREHQASKTVSESIGFSMEIDKILYTLLKIAKINTFYTDLFVTDKNNQVEIQGVLKGISLENINKQRLFNIYFTYNFSQQKSFNKRLYIALAYIFYNNFKPLKIYKTLLADYLFPEIYKKIKFIWKRTKN
jgi:glycosyltransferase involved in cell wall biosynthesis